MFIAAAGSTGRREGAKPTEHELRTELVASLDAVRVDGTSDNELAASLRSLAHAATRLARALESR